MALSNGIQVPGWAVGAISAGAVILGLGIAIGDYRRGAENSDELNVLRNSVRIDNVTTRVGQLDFRLCRIEKALNISPDQSCFAGGVRP